MFADATPHDDWERDVWLTARRLAMLHLSMVRVLCRELGDEAGRDLARKVIYDYGLTCGELAREQVGDNNEPEQMGKIPDLPQKGWRSERPSADPRRHVVTFCPLAAVWKEQNAADLGRIYCTVDQAKINGFNENYTCVHEQNVLDGDPLCEIVIVDREPGK